ncbi:UNVERIFIED_ORG: hypothetical protein B2H98_08080 [Clostridium botulinum]
MNKIELGLNEMEETVIAFSYMMENIEYRKEYCDILESNKIEFPIPDLERLSNILVRNKNKENLLQDYNVLRKVTELGYLSIVIDNAYQKINLAVTKSFIERIKGEKERIAPIKYLEEFKNNKKAFIAFCSGKVKVVFKSDGQYTFTVKSLSGKWIPRNYEYMKIVYNKFIENCESELEIQKHNIENLKGIKREKEYSNMLEQYEKCCDLVDEWDTSFAVTEAIEKIKRDERFIIQISDQKSKEKDNTKDLAK